MSISELAEAIKIKEKEPQLELKPGDRVKIIQYYKDGSHSYSNGREGELIEIRGEWQAYSREYRIKLDNGHICIAYKVIKVAEGKKEEWKEITADCKLELEKLMINIGFTIHVRYEKIVIGTIMSNCSIDNKPISMYGGYKVEYIEGNHFRILKRC